MLGISNEKKSKTWDSLKSEIFECLHDAQKKKYFQILENVLILGFSNTRGSTAQVYINIPKYKIASTSKPQHK